MYLSSYYSTLCCVYSVRSMSYDQRKVTSRSTVRATTASERKGFDTYRDRRLRTLLLLYYGCRMDLLKCGSMISAHKRIYLFPTGLRSVQPCQAASQPASQPSWQASQPARRHDFLSAGRVKLDCRHERHPGCDTDSRSISATVFLTRLSSLLVHYHLLLIHQ